MWTKYCEIKRRLEITLHKGGYAYRICDIFDGIDIVTNKLVVCVEELDAGFIESVLNQW